MPKKLFLSAAGEYADNGKVSLDDALQIAERFGVSFRSYRLGLAYTFHILDEEYKDLSKRISDYKPDKKKAELGMEIESIYNALELADKQRIYSEMMRVTSRELYRTVMRVNRQPG